MLESHPPRREPRVLALALVNHALVYAVVDPFEVRGVGELPTGVGLRLALSRLVLQTRPTVFVVFGAESTATAPRAALRTVAARHGLPVVVVTAATCATLRAAAPALGTIEAQYPEVRGLLRFVAVREVLPLALAALSTLSFPPRAYTYASRLSARAAPSVARARARGSRSPRLPHGRSARRGPRPERA